jgi:hypothetical protein
MALVSKSFVNAWNGLSKLLATTRADWATRYQITLSAARPRTEKRHHRFTCERGMISVQPRVPALEFRGTWRQVN